MDTLIRDLRHATRMLLKTPVFTIVVVFTLAVGIGANTAMFSIVNAVLLQGLPFQHADRIVDVTEAERRDMTGGAIAPATFIDWRKMTTSFDDMAAFATRIYNVTPQAGEPVRLRGTVASTTFFDVLGVSPILGRGFTKEDSEPGRGQNIVLSFGFWQRQFAGRSDVINQAVRLNGQPYTIVGVMPATLNYPDTSNFWVPASYDVPPCFGPPNVDPRDQRGAHCLRGIARLKQGTSLQQANAELKIVSDQLGKQYPQTSSNFVGLATPLQDRLVRTARTPLLVLLGAVGCVLLIVVANVANLLMARATVRAREFAIRAAIGAGRATLIRQLLTESALIALVGGGLGVLLAFWGVDLMLALDPGEVPRVAPVNVDGYALTFAVVLSLLTGVLFGVVPAWQASRPELQNTLKDNTRGSTSDRQRHFARAGLVLAEVSICLVLLVGAGLLFRSLMTLIDMPLGFTTSRMLTMSIAPTGENYRSPDQFKAYWDRVLDRVSAVPGVERVALTGSLPMGGGMSILAYQPDNKPIVPANQQPLSNYVDVGAGYFSTMGIPVLRGREFTAQDLVVNPRVIIINEAMAKRDYPNEDPIGHRFSFNQGEGGEQDWVEIVGVVGNVRQYRADEAPVPITYAPSSSAPSRAQNLMVRTTSNATAVAGSVRAAVQSLDPSLPISPPRTLDEVVGASLTQRRFNMTLLIVFAAIALILAIAGIYGTVAYSVAQRTQEIGIRVALGATSREILSMVLFGSLKPVIAGLGIGLVLALALTRLLAGLVYGVSTTDPLTFVTLPAVLGVVAFLAGLVPAWRATRVDPLEALRVD